MNTRNTFLIAILLLVFSVLPCSGATIIYSNNVSASVFEYDYYGWTYVTSIGSEVEYIDFPATIYYTFSALPYFNTPQDLSASVSLYNVNTTNFISLSSLDDYGTVYGTMPLNLTDGYYALRVTVGAHQYYEDVAGVTGIVASGATVEDAAAGSPNVEWGDSSYDPGDTARFYVGDAPAGSWAKIYDSTTSTTVATYTGVYWTWYSYTLPAGEYGHSYTVYLYNSANNVLDTDTMSVSGTAPPGGEGGEYTLAGKVYDAETGGIIQNATITVGSVASDSTDSRGHYGVSIPGGIYSTTCTASGYGSQSLDLLIGQHSTQNWYLSPSNPTTTATNTLYGVVVSLNTGLPVSGVAVSAEGKTVFSSSRGYYELGLSSAGTYAVTASKTDYETLVLSVPVSGETNRDMQITPNSYSGGGETTPPGGGDPDDPSDDDAGGEDEDGDGDGDGDNSDGDGSTGGDGDNGSDGDADDDGIPDNVDDSDGDGIADNDDDSPYGRSDRIGAQATMSWLAENIPDLIKSIVLVVFMAAWGIKIGK